MSMATAADIFVYKRAVASETCRMEDSGMQAQTRADQFRQSLIQSLIFSLIQFGTQVIRQFKAINPAMEQAKRQWSKHTRAYKIKYWKEATKG